MRSRAELRAIGEWLLRAALLALLAVSLWRAWQPQHATTGLHDVAASKLATDLPGLLADRDITGLDVRIDALPTSEMLDLLVALRRAGTAVRWNGSPPPLAVEIVPLRDPAGGSRLSVAPIGGLPLAIADSAGALDSLAAAKGATIEIAAPVGAVGAAQGAYVAAAMSRSDEGRRPVLVLGRLGWESRFVIQALGEAGWTVRVRIPTAPAAIVADAGILPIDTARYDAVIALDSTAADLAPAIARFVAQGGGLVAAGGALTLESLRPLVPGRAGERQPGRILLAEDTVTTRDLPVRAVSALRDDALSLERTTNGVMLAARRAGLGRVAAVGYDESWRWRMLGGTSGPAAHRAWWSRVVGSVSPERASAETARSNAAPVAALVEALGPAKHASVSHAPTTNDHSLPLILLAAIASALLAETASRRFRGAR